MDTLDEGFQRRVMHLAGWELPQKLSVLTQSFLSEVRPVHCADNAMRLCLFVVQTAIYIAEDSMTCTHIC